MTSKRKFYRTVIHAELLSEEPILPMSLRDVDYQITEGYLSGELLESNPDNEILDGPTAAKALIAQGSDPEFFELDEDGNDIEEDDR